MSDLERRVTELERRMDMESGLRASGDRDLADLTQRLRAQHHTIQALAITQSQHTEMLDRVHEKLDRIVAMLTRLIENEE